MIKSEWIVQDDHIREVISIGGYLNENIVQLNLDLGLGVAVQVYCRLNHLFVPEENYEEMAGYLKELSLRDCPAWIKFFHKPDSYPMYLVDLFCKVDGEMLCINDEITKEGIGISRSKKNESSASN